MASLLAEPKMMPIRNADVHHCVGGPPVFATDTGDSFQLFLIVGVSISQLTAPIGKPVQLRTCIVQPFLTDTFQFNTKAATNYIHANVIYDIYL